MRATRATVEAALTSTCSSWPRRDAQPFDELLEKVYAFADPAIAGHTSDPEWRPGELVWRPGGGHA